MDVVVFKISSVKKESKKIMFLLANSSYDYTPKDSSMGRWLKNQYPSASIEYLYETKSSLFIKDHKVTMSRDDYTEFCLKWM